MNGKNDLFREIVAAAKKPYLALILFGSAARGDMSSESDVDVLQVTAAPVPSYTVGRCNFSCYARQTIGQMARLRTLFAAHLALEAHHLDGDKSVLEQLRREAVVPDLEYVVQEVGYSLPLLDISMKQYDANPRRWSEVAMFLARTMVYAKSFREGRTTFALREEDLADELGRVVCRGYRRVCGWSDFVWLRSEISQALGARCANDAETTEAHIVNSWGVSRMAVALGLRLIHQGDGSSRPPYDELIWEEGVWVK